MKKIQYTLALALSFGFGLKAQQLPVSNNLYLNPTFMNSSYAGMEESFRITGTFRNQWSGFNGAPTTTNLLVDGPLVKDKWGVYFGIANDQADIIGQLDLKAGLNYRVTLAEKHKLNFSLGAQIGRQQINFDRVSAQDQSDQMLFTGLEQDWTPDATFGLLYNFKSLNVGIYAENLLQSKYYYVNTTDELELNYSPLRQLTGHVSYRFSFLEDKSLHVDPMVLVRSAAGLPLMPEAQLYVNYKERVWLGGIYRLNNTVAVSAGVSPFEDFKIQYSYEMYPSTYKGYVGATHEFGIVYNIKSSREKSDYKNDLMMDRLMRQNKQQFEELERLKNENEDIVQKLDSAQKQIDAIKKLKTNYAGYEDSLKSDPVSRSLVTSSDFNNTYDSLKKVTQDHDELIKQLQIELARKANSTATNDGSRPSDITSSNIINENTDELTFQEGVYVVIGAFIDMASAREYQKTIKRETEMDTRVVQNKSGKWYFVYTNRHDDIEAAKAEITELNKMDIDHLIVGEIWFYIP